MFRARHIPPEGQHPEWLQVIWQVNDDRPGTFLKPEIKPWWAGGMVEEYPEARVIFVGDETVRVCGKTDEVEAAITAAARKLGYVVN
jgi:hypothetical protein